uniref:Uncharacterized protein n=1 Tax=Moniliophthora roreri TaxID=221103 RepID=A0A0W0G1P8_MONRR
MVDHQKYEES